MSILGNEKSKHFLLVFKLWKVFPGLSFWVIPEALIV